MTQQNDTIELQFPDGTVAEFKLVSTSPDTWQWNNQAWDKNGVPIGRNGAFVPNPYQGIGASGGGAAVVSNLGGPTSYTYTLSSNGENCTYNVEVGVGADGTVVVTGGFTLC